MRHIPEGRLRRLVDEPLAVPDSDTAHVTGCARCGARQRQLAHDAAMASAFFGRPHPVPDIDGAWRSFQTASGTPQHSKPAQRVRAPSRWHWGILAVPVPSPAALALGAVVVVAIAGGALLATVLAPGTAPTTAPSANIQALTDVAGISGGAGVLGGFDKASGSLTLPFGELTWKSAAASRSVPSIAAAEAATGLDVRLPKTLPSGVGAPTNILVQSEVTATITFGARSRSLDGQVLTVTAGPAVLVEFGGSSSLLGVPTLATFEMGRPDVSSSDSTTRQLEAYVLSQPGLPTGLSQEIRLLGGNGAVFPLAGLHGASLSQVDIDGSAGVLVSDNSVGASGVIWDAPDGVVHAALGLLDQNDILSVADQLG